MYSRSFEINWQKNYRESSFLCWMTILSLHNTYLGRCVERWSLPCLVSIHSNWYILHKTRVCDIVLEVKLDSNRKDYAIYIKYAFSFFSMVGVTIFCLLSPVFMSTRSWFMAPIIWGEGRGRDPKLVVSSLNLGLTRVNWS